MIKAEGRFAYNGCYKFQRIGKWVKGMSIDLKQGYFVCWTDQSTYFYEFNIDSNPVDNVALPVVFDDLAAGVRSKIVPAID